MNEKKFSLVREMKKLIIILYNASRWMFPVMIVQNILQSLLPFLNIWYGYRILEEMLSGMSKESIMGLVWRMALWNLGLGLLVKCLERVRIVLRERVYLKVDENIIDRTLVMDYEMMESKYRSDLLRTVQEGQSAGNDICTFCDKLCGVIQDVFSLLYAVILLRTIFVRPSGEAASILASPIAPVILVLLYLLVILAETGVMKRQNRLYDEAYQDNLSGNRKLQYFYNLIFYEYHNGKDFRLYRMEKLLMKYLRQFFESIRERTMRFLKDTARWEAVCLAAEGVLLFLAYLFVGARALTGLMNAAEAMKYVSTLTLFSQACKSLMNRYGELNRILFSLRNYSKYLELGNSQQKSVGTAAPVQDSARQVNTDKAADKKSDKIIDEAVKSGPITGVRMHPDGLELEFRNVSFHYPDSKEMILDHVSFQLSLRGKLAVVGKNGAGKSTFIKLLCRLYHPTEGQIFINGVDIENYSFEEYRKLFAVVFQDFKLYAFGLGANVAASEEYDKKKVWDALEAAGIRERAEKFPRGLDTYLYNWFDGGVEISGGEEQKIAIARALYKDAPIVILDEPTSALDPISEYEIYRKCDLLVKDRAAIYISHRMSSCRFCDQILVFERGNVTQRGSHEELMEQEGLYKQLWKAQAQYYREAPGV